MTLLTPPSCSRCGGKPKAALHINDGKRIKVKETKEKISVVSFWGFNLTVYLCQKCYREFERWLK